MIAGRFGVWDLLALTPPVLGAVQLLLPFAFRVRPARLARRAVGLAGLWVVFAAAALGLPRLEQAAREDLSGDGFVASNSWIFTAVFAVIMTGVIGSCAVTVVRECRKDVLMQPVAERELRILRPLAAAVHAEGSASAEWAVTAVDCAEEDCGTAAAPRPRCCCARPPRRSARHALTTAPPAVTQAPPVTAWR